MLSGLQTGEESLGTLEPEYPKPGPPSLGLSLQLSRTQGHLSLAGWLLGQSPKKRISQSSPNLNSFNDYFFSPPKKKKVPIM